MRWYFRNRETRKLIAQNAKPYFLEYKDRTIVGYLVQVEENEYDFGISVCHPKDNFCIKKGTRLALQRLLGHKQNSLGGTYSDKLGKLKDMKYEDKTNLVIQETLAKFNKYL